MNKKIITLILVILVSFCFLSIVVADHATNNDNNETDHNPTDKDKVDDNSTDKNKTDDKSKDDKSKTDDKSETDDKAKKAYIIASENIITKVYCRCSKYISCRIKGNENSQYFIK